MNITGKKNLQNGETVIYYPDLHWMFLIKPILLVAVSIVLLITKELTAAYVLVWADTVDFAYRIAVVIIFIAALIYLLWTIIEFYLVEYSITNKRLILKKGFFTSTLVDMPIEKVESIICVQSLLGRIFNYGTILVSGVGGMTPRYSTIRKPHKIRRIIYTVIDKNKMITITREEAPKPVLVKQVRRPEIQYGTFVTSYPAGKRMLAESLVRK
ncbi:hypothetical protein FACS189476_06470 [Spirochaetia bacterium]|nr:hypothetical protein FACS189476_06470 [Spirochaetia bacterium]